jgi:hypothetical protein
MKIYVACRNVQIHQSHDLRTSILRIFAARNRVKFLPIFQFTNIIFTATTNQLISYNLFFFDYYTYSS